LIFLLQKNLFKRTIGLLLEIARRKKNSSKILPNIPDKEFLKLIVQEYIKPQNSFGIIIYIMLILLNISKHGITRSVRSNWLIIGPLRWLRIGKFSKKFPRRQNIYFLII